MLKKLILRRKYIIQSDLIFSSPIAIEASEREKL
jgi:hypothetical protein